jgi:hypothetical protein
MSHDVKMAQTRTKKGVLPENLHFSLMMFTEALGVFVDSSKQAFEESGVIAATTTENYTGPGVLPAEDATRRNTIIIVVTSTVVAFSIVAGITFMLLHRRGSKTAEERTRENVIFPPIQVDLLNSPRTSGYLSSQSPVDSDGLNAVLPEKPLSPKEQQEQELIKDRFRARQRTFKIRREERRESPGDTDGQLGYERRTYIEPSSNDEQEVFSTLIANIEGGTDKKTVLYRELLRKWHPDKNRSDREKAKRVFQYLQSNKTWFLDTIDHNS